MQPNYETNAPNGWMGDPRRGAAMGGTNVIPAAGKTPEQLEAEACDLDRRAAEALRLKADRPGDGWKRDAYMAAWSGMRSKAQELRDLIPEAERARIYSGKVTLRRVRLDSGGYDETGAYWGIGEPLYWAAADSGVEYDETFRAGDRAEAKAYVRETLPCARFYR